MQPTKSMQSMTRSQEKKTNEFFKSSSANIQEFFLKQFTNPAKQFTLKSITFSKMPKLNILKFSCLDKATITLAKVFYSQTLVDYTFVMNSWILLLSHETVPDRRNTNPLNIWARITLETNNYLDVCCLSWVKHRSIFFKTNSGLVSTMYFHIQQISNWVNGHCIPQKSFLVTRGEVSVGL